MLNCFLLAIVSATTAIAQETKETGQMAVPEGATGSNLGAIIPLEGEITDITAESIKRRIAEARKLGAKIIVLELDTPGGMVTSSIAIADMLRSLTDVKTVAWVNPNALSGGSLVAVACNEIVMSLLSRMGDSQVIMGDLTGVEAVPKDLQPKAYTPVIHDFRTSARRNGYSEVLAEAFVMPELEVWWLENTKTGEREFVFTEEKEKRMGEDRPSGDGQADSGSEVKVEPPAPEWKLVEKYHDEVLNMDVKIRQPIESEKELLAMSPGEAIAYGFCKGIVSSESDLRSHYHLSNVVRLSPLWSESLAVWLTSGVIRGILLVLILLGVYVEFHAPGLSLPGLVALIALIIFVGAPYLTGLANIWEIVLIFLGFGLIGLEVFVIPGFGVAGISGAVLVLVGLIATFIPEEPGRTFPMFFPTMPSTLIGLRIALSTIVTAMMVSFAGMVMLSRYLPKMPLLRKLVPANPTPSQVLMEDAYAGAARVGDVGRAEGTLRPAGKARFADVLVDVVTQGEFVDGNTPVEVIERRGNRVVVREAKA